MGMTIDEFDEYAKAHDYVIFTRQQYEHVIDVFNNYELLSLDYYGRLKADMVAMLTEIQLEIDELEVPLLYLAEDYEGGVLDCKKIIQQKINELKGDQEGEE